jgi:integrase
MAKKLTAVAVDQAKAKADRYEIADAGCPGLRLVVQESGAKSWLMRFRSPVERDRNGRGKARKLTLGPLAGDGEACDGEPKIGRPLTLADARALATDVIRKIRQGVDPALQRRTEKRAAMVAAVSNKVEDVFAQFMAKHVRKKRKGTPIRESTRRKTGRLLGLEPKDGDLSTWAMCDPKSGVLASWAGRDVGAITKRDVLDLLDAMIARGAPVGANRTLSALKQAFGWCVKRDILAASPCDHIDAPSPEQSQERELSGQELVAIWRAADRAGYPYGQTIQVLMLTGQRFDEVHAAPRNEFDFANRVWTLPGERTKNGREHRVPLSDQVIAILEKLPKIKSKAGYLFTVSGDVPFSNLSRHKKRLDAAALEELRKIDPNISELVPWRQHHMRHTLKTWMQRARIPKDVRNAVQNHFDGDMDELYGHYSFEKEKREALDRWAEHIKAIVAGTNVVELQRAK